MVFQKVLRRMLVINGKESMTNKNLIKDMVDPAIQYEKHNSFDHFRSKKTSNLSAIRHRIEQLNKRLASQSGKDYFLKIVKKAAHQILLEEDAPRAFKLYPHTYNEISKINDEQLPRYLFYRYRYEIFPEEKIVDDFPPCLQVEITSVCNYRCVFCYQTDSELTEMGNGHMGNMTLELFKKVIDEANGKCEAITLASRGEPLINKEFVKMLKYMNGKFLASKVNTNASLLTEEKCHGILQTDLQTLVFSCDAAEEPLYSQLRVGGSLEIVLKKIRMFNEIKQKQYPDSKLITRVSGVKVNHQQNIDEMDKFWGELVDEVAFVKYNPWENTYERSINNEERPCTDLWRRSFIWWDGRVNPCDVDYRSHLCVGNVRDSSVSDLWRSSSYAELRRKHLERNRQAAFPCNRCTQI